MLDVVSGDVLSVAADALVVPIDGTMRPPNGNLERILGNVGRQFLRRWPEADLVEELDSQVDLPLPLGKAATMEIAAEAVPFRQLVVVSTLHHAQPLDQHGKVAVARTAFASALDRAAHAGVKRLATAVLQGGWRLTPQAGLRGDASSDPGGEGRGDAGDGRVPRCSADRVVAGTGTVRRALGERRSTGVRAAGNVRRSLRRRSDNG